MSFSFDSKKAVLHRRDEPKYIPPNNSNSFIKEKPVDLKSTSK